MIALSFLGLGNYKKTTYVHQGRKVTTEFFAEALPTFFPDLEKIFVFVTPTVLKHENFENLKLRLGDLMAPVPIPEGHSEKDLWGIFDALTGTVDEGERVVFDITNSYRSLPFLVFLAAAYLRAAKDVEVANIVYGAFEAKGSDNQSPVFDLTPFVSLLDWLTATDQFVQTGDARRLATLLNPDLETSGPAAEASQAISSVSLSAFLCQPFHLFPEASKLEARLDAAGQDLGWIPKPYEVLRDQIIDSFGDFGVAFDSENPREGLEAEFRLIEWYYQNNQLIQAITLAREWLIDAVTFRLVGRINLKSSDRRRYERALSGLPRVGRSFRNDDTGELEEFAVQT
jgi:hypothetical protein